MNYYIKTSMRAYPSLYSTPLAVLSHTFATLGNGVDLDNKGWLGHCDGECYPFPEPEAVLSIYPWNDNPRYQSFHDLKGCRNEGFKESLQYFISCIMMTPDSVEHIKDWKKGITEVVAVMNSPTIVDEFTPETTVEEFLESIKDEIKTGNADNSVKKVWYFDVQWSDTPSSVEEEVRHIWCDHELGNDRYIHKVELDEDLFEAYPKVYFWLKHKGVLADEKVIIHWWW